MTLQLLGRRWYFRLHGKDGLLEAHQIALDERGLIIAKVKKGRERDNYFYTYFPDYLSYWNFALQTKQYERCFNEVPLPYVLQKLRFDIDMDGQSDEELGWRVVTALAIAVGTVMLEHGVQIDFQRDFIVCSSHSKDPYKLKLSYHVIIDNYACIDNRELKELTNQIRARIPGPYIAWFDRAITDAYHPLRVYGAIKPGTNRAKHVLESWVYLHGTRRQVFQTIFRAHHNIDIAKLQASLMTCTSHCRLIRIPLPEQQEIAELEVSDEILAQIDSWLDKLGLTGKVKFLRRSGNFLICQRLSAYDCPVCGHRHESENPCFILGSSTILFWCRRSAQKLAVSGNHWLTEKSVDEELTAPPGFQPALKASPTVVRAVMAELMQCSEDGILRGQC